MDDLKALIPYSEVENKIVAIRKQNVIADADVADKFPNDYMFVLRVSCRVCGQKF